jgi:predicted ATPase
MTELPTGTVTFLFTDVEGSTRLLHELGAEVYAEALAEHRRLVREACVAEGGVEVDTQGDAFFVAFPTAPGALEAAKRIRAELESGRIRLRIGLHTGSPFLTDEGYVGPDVHRAARIAATGHGGQILVSQATAALVDTDLRDLGEHRLKDLSAPERIFQLGDERFPPLRTISNTNLPRPASSFVGREGELLEVLGRIEQGARLLTLIGPGGSGKTRLAIEAAATLVPAYQAGVFWVGLAAFRDPALVTGTIAQTLGAKDGLAEHIGERELLLLLDNLEQVIEAAPDLARLVAACPNLTVLVTSRELLRVQGEVGYEVPTLAQPEAVSLFCARSGLEPSEEIAELCAGLDELPLAVELAAARTRVLTPAQILERLSQRLDLLKGGRDADPRQQTLAATIAWSYDLLSVEEQRLFRSLSVFAGGCTLEAAEEVAGADLDTLQSLVEKSLLRFTASEAGGRYWMLETIREYAATLLEGVGESEELGRRHVDHYLGLALEAAPHLDGSREQAAWLRTVELERNNVSRALSFLEHRDPARVMDLAASVWRYWQMRGYLTEGRQWIEKALRLDSEPTVKRTVALGAASYLAYLQGDIEAARQFAEEQLAIGRALDDGASTALALELLGHAEGADGRPGRQIELYKESLTYAEHPRRSDTVYSLGHVLVLEGEYERATGWLEQARELDEAAGDEWGLSGALVGLGYARLGQGRDAEARALFRRGLKLVLPLGDKQRIATGLDALAAAMAEEEPELAATLLGAAAILREQNGLRVATFSGHWNPSTWDALKTQLPEELLERSVERGRELDPEAAVALVRASLD